MKKKRTLKTVTEKVARKHGIRFTEREIRHIFETVLKEMTDMLIEDPASINIINFGTFRIIDSFYCNTLGDGKTRHKKKLSFRVSRKLTRELNEELKKLNKKD